MSGFILENRMFIEVAYRLMHALTREIVLSVLGAQGSLYLLVALATFDLGDHQKFALKWAVLASMALLVGGVLFGGFPFHRAH